ncbi:MAG TPA: peptidoglycan DD-metalloendopeptidase family protein [Vicinamibacterales bacterium]|nr:peptidoglycan DD-metalloendopeptidase family protein [Vicinamibacterales bacterium]
MKALPAESADSARYLANRLDAGSRSDPKIASLVETPIATRRGEPSGSPESKERQKLATLAGEFESMLLLQMLREMRKSGSWKDEEDEKDGFGADTLFDTLDMELASYITKAQGLGLEQSLVKQVLGEDANAIVPVQLPAVNLPTIAPDVRSRRSSDPDVRSRRSSDRPQGADAPSPVADRVETSPFGWRRDPFSGATTYHRGVDLRAAYGEPIGAADAGTVVFAGEQRGYGQTVVVEHAGGVRTRYAHLSSLVTEAGADVKAGDTIGRAGKSGRATGTHLHFEVTQHGRQVDPHTFVAGGLKVERVTADWGVANGPTLPGVASERHGSGAD